jgi:hypothetical protein
VEKVIYNARRNLEIAWLGLDDMSSGDARRERLGLYHAVTYGKSVIDILGNIRAFNVQGFDDWFTATQNMINDDPLLRWFIDLRNEILKHGPPALYDAISLVNFGEFFGKLFADAPPGSYSFISPAGTGWYVEKADGSRDYHYVHAPPELRAEYGVVTHIRDVPDKHLDEQLEDKSAKAVIGKCLAFLEAMIETTSKMFVPPAPNKSHSPG